MRDDYNDLTQKVQDYLVGKEVPVPRWRGHQADEYLAFTAWVLRAFQELRVQVDEKDRQEVAKEVAGRIVGLGVLQPFLDVEDIEEIIVRNGFVMTERKGQIQDEGELAKDEYFYNLARRIADMEGKGLGAAEPKIKVGLPEGSRFAATIPPLSREGTAINIRRFSRKRMTLDELVERGSADEETIDFLAEVANSMKASVVFSGRPGAGKTTWLNAFSSHLPPYAQVSVVETFHELQPQVAHHHHLVVEEETGEMSDAINTCVLRMRPDVLMIGEVVSSEAIQYILALNLGIVSHTTTHSQSAEMALSRLEGLATTEVSVEQLRPIIGAGLGLVVHLTKEYNSERRKYVRYMQEILAVKGYSNGDYQLETLKERKGDTYTPLQGGMEIFR